MPGRKLPTITFLGLGIMGLPMALRLAEAGFQVRAWNRTATRTKDLHHPNIVVAPTAAAAAEGADIVIVMLSTGPVVDEVLFTPDHTGRSLAESLAPAALVIVMSSIPVETTQSQGKHLRQMGVRYLDAPVSGGERGAKDGTLTIMTGGETDDFAAAAEVFKPLGRAIHVGPTGCGQLAKLSNQLIVGLTIAAVSEALILAETGGANPASVRQAMLGGFADSAILRQHGERMIHQNFVPGAYGTTQLKDLTTAVTLAKSLHLNLSFLELCREKFESMCAHDMGGLDHSALYLELKKFQQ